MAKLIARLPYFRPQLLPAILLALLLAGCGGGGGETGSDSTADSTDSESDDSDSGTGGDKDADDETDTATGAINTVIELSWTHSPDPVDGYIVYRGSTPDAAPTRFVQRVRAGLDEQAPSIEFNAGTDLGLKQGDRVCFWLSAYVADQESELSESKCTGV